jgi:hypothetical protein
MRPIHVVLSQKTIYGFTIREHAQEPHAVLLEERQDPIVEEVGRGDGVSSV